MTAVGDPSRGAHATGGSPGARGPDPLIGRLLGGRYQITARLARGGMATVYRAVDTRLTRTVAVKVMHVGLGDDDEFARKFDREARAAAKLSHPNVVSVFDQGQDVLDGHVSRPYIVMEYVAGQTLRDVITAEAPMPPARACELIEPVLAALAAAHDAGLVHRDVKPENVLISERGQLKVADFGLAKAISSQTSTATQGLLIGTVSYLPPELVVSGKADARSDVYSAGVVLFELMTGMKPHSGETPIQVAYAHVHKDVPPPSSFPGRWPVPPYVDALVARATAREPMARPRDARLLLAEVRKVRAALDAGLHDAPELMAAFGARSPDLEVTEVVPVPTRAVQPQPVRQSSPPTLRDAPPPVALRQTPLSPSTPPQRVPVDRLAAGRRRQAQKRRRGWAAFLLVLMLTAVAALAGWYLMAGRFTTAPALATLSKAEAEQVATKSGLGIRFVDGFSETVASGLIVSTDPSAGTKVLRGTRLEAVVSRGPERYLMPIVVGLSQAAAETAIQKANLAVGKVSRGFSDTVAVGVVLSASKSSGASLKRDTPVDLVVCQGPKPIKVINYAGKPYADAAAALTKAGFVVQEKTANSDTVAKDLVIKQSPKSGTAKKGDTIALTRSLGPVMLTVPNVRRMGVRAAEKVLRDAGFKTQVRAVTINYIGVGFVVYTSPGATKLAPKGSTVTIYVV